MNTEIIIHPKLRHYGLTTANLDAMIDWYRKVLGMTVNHRSTRGGPPRAAGAPQFGPPFSAVAFLSNDEVNHRLVFFEVPGVVVDPDKSRHARLQHVAFEYRSLDDLLGTYVRLKGLDILPLMAMNQGMQTSLYYTDPDQNIVELEVTNYDDEWTATEHIRVQAPGVAFVDPEKMLEARRAGASPAEVHERAVAREFAPARPFDGRAAF